MDNPQIHIVLLLEGIHELETMDVGGGDVFSALVVSTLHDFTGHFLGGIGVEHGETTIGTATTVYFRVFYQIQPPSVLQQGFGRMIIRIKMTRRTRFEIEYPMRECVS